MKWEKKRIHLRTDVAVNRRESNLWPPPCNKALITTDRNKNLFSLQRSIDVCFHKGALCKISKFHLKRELFRLSWEKKVNEACSQSSAESNLDHFEPCLLKMIISYKTAFSVIGECGLRLFGKCHKEAGVLGRGVKRLTFTQATKARVCYHNQALSQAFPSYFWWLK